MARPASKHPTDGELQILRILWANSSCTLAEVCDGLREHRDVATTTVATMLKVMLDKKLVKRDAATGRTYRWSAAVSQEKTAGSLLGKLVDGVFEGSASRLVAHLVETQRFSEQELAELEELVDAKRRSGQKKVKGGK
ncbi:BlaI/MecI/CopY family transcriptional regulator [Aeoliella mucimassa]|uniref:Penicillinase repressor n=1 Tax=Aeoliella mucimassa TaxID=2527972 RepID=A0A518AH74_9BACT|nr:BlaI/MecI/CopY family transcriptional regulator [Aeoliella mucimassa]QDU54083.1 Penicillinase repressor [Aeoliella mucimassa]